MKNYLQLGASVSLICLIFLLCSWELFLAPFKNQSSWLVLKIIPLLISLFDVFLSIVFFLCVAFYVKANHP